MMSDEQQRFVFRRRCHCLDLAWRGSDEGEAHVGADVQGHIKKDQLRICARKYPRNISQQIST
jgi:hypothetical protein